MLGLGGLNLGDFLEEYVDSVPTSTSDLGIFMREYANDMIQITEAIRAQLPTLLPPSSALIQTIFIAAFSLSLLALLFVILISSFIMAMNPSGERHWRHMTPKMYGLLFVYMIMEVMVFIAGVSVMDILVVVGPLMIGGMGCVAPWCMRKVEEGKLKLEDGLKNGEESV